MDKKQFKKYLLPSAFLAFLAGIAFLGVISLFNDKDADLALNSNDLGASNPRSQWTVIKDFQGYYTKLDETKIPNGANGRGQNTTANNGDRISIRNQGYEIFPSTDTASTTMQRIGAVHTFRTKDGSNILMRTRSTFVEYFEETGDSWTILKGGYTTNQDFGFADYNKTTDITSYVYFGNGVEDFSKWTGVHTTLTQIATSGASVLFVTDAGDFGNTGTVTVCGAEEAYNSKTATTITLSGAVSTECASGSGIPESVETHATNPKGNIYIAFDNRLIIAGIASTSQAVYFSKYGAPTDFLNADLVSAATDADADIFNLVEGGGAVTGLAMDENSLYIFKRSIIYKVTLTDTDYTVTQLKPFDGRSQTTGLISKDGTFSGGNEVFFVTPDNQIMAIQRVEGVDYPQIVPISDNIKNTVANMKFDNTSGIVFRDKAYFTAKSDIDANSNNTVLVWNIREKMWDSPTIGWNVENFTVYDDGTSEELYVADAIAPNIYKVGNEKQDGIFEIKANWRSKQFDFGIPESLKEINNVYVEGYITPNTTLTISLLLDEDGYTQTFTTEFAGTETDYIFNRDGFNSFGFSSFGSKRFGGGGVDDLNRKFRIYLGKNFRASPFYNAQIEFASEGLNDSWEVTAVGFDVAEYTKPHDRNLFKAFSK
jgi:hypothetical protein